jgi:hypothetical protein
MPDVQVNVNVDGRTVFVHGANGAVDPIGFAIASLQMAAAHFQAIKLTTATAQAAAGAQQAQNTKGPSI